MVLLMILLSALAFVAVVATVITVVRDGYRPVPTRASAERAFETL
jgi:hypothetical protein